MTAIALLPEDHYVTFGKERSEEDERRVFLSACVFQKAPKEGWSSRGERFGHPLSCDEPCPPQWAHDDRVIFGVNSDPEEPETLERLLINAIAKYWGAS